MTSASGFDPDLDLRVVGQRVPRVEGRAKVTGAVYAADVQLPGRLWGKVLRSPYPYARIRHIDTRRARELPGVQAVITGQDIPPTLVGRRLRDVPVLARDVVRFVHLCGNLHKSIYADSGIMPIGGSVGRC